MDTQVTLKVFGVSAGVVEGVPILMIFMDKSVDTRRLDNYGDRIFRGESLDGSK
jgi:hypothetical protein